MIIFFFAKIKINIMKEMYKELFQIMCLYSSSAVSLSHEMGSTFFAKVYLQTGLIGKMLKKLLSKIRKIHKERSSVD